MAADSMAWTGSMAAPFSAARADSMAAVDCAAIGEAIMMTT
jgi:hypothetical protein